MQLGLSLCALFYTIIKFTRISHTYTLVFANSERVSEYSDNTRLGTRIQYSVLGFLLKKFNLYIEKNILLLKKEYFYKKRVNILLSNDKNIRKLLGYSYILALKIKKLKFARLGTLSENE